MFSIGLYCRLGYYDVFCQLPGCLSAAGASSISKFALVSRNCASFTQLQLAAMWNPVSIEQALQLINSKIGNNQS
jgi:hypothetical protein